MSDANKALVRRWFEEVWNQKSEAAIDQMFDYEGKVYGLPDPNSVLTGPEAFKPVHRTFVGAFPDLRITVEEIVAEGDTVAVRWKATAKHQGDHFGFPASAKDAVVHGSSFLIIRNGKILEGRNYMDLTALFQQLRAA